MTILVSKSNNSGVIIKSDNNLKEALGLGRLAYTGEEESLKTKHLWLFLKEFCC